MPARLERVSLKLIDTTVTTRPLIRAHVSALARSMKPDGRVQQPIGLFKKGARFVLGPGGHRLAAAKELKWDAIDAMVEPYVSDAQVRTAQLIENVQRENMTAIEEAAAVEKAVNDAGGQMKVAADKMGKDVKWVETRLALLSLTPESSAALVEGRITLRHAQLLAKVGDAKTQNEILNRAEGSGGDELRTEKTARTDEYNAPMDTDELAVLVGHVQRDLTKVTWRTDCVFGAHGACDKCPFNSKNRGELFVDAGNKAKPVCMDAKCFDEKKTMTRLGARRAGFYLRNAKLKPTPKNVEAACKARDAVYVSVAGVKAALKQINSTKRLTGGGAKAGKSGKKESTEKSRIEAEQKRAIDRELSNRRKSWNKKAVEMAMDLMRKNPLAAPYLALLSFTDSWMRASRGRLDKQSQERKEFVALLRGAITADANALARVGRLLVMPNKPRDSWTSTLECLLDESGRFSHTMESSLIPHLIEACRLNTEELGPKPTFEAIKSELFPPEPKKDAKPSKAAGKAKGPSRQPGHMPRTLVAM